MAGFLLVSPARNDHVVEDGVVKSMPSCTTDRFAYTKRSFFLQTPSQLNRNQFFATGSYFKRAGFAWDILQFLTKDAWPSRCTDAHMLISPTRNDHFFNGPPANRIGTMRKCADVSSEMLIFETTCMHPASFKHELRTTDMLLDTRRRITRAALKRCEKQKY